MQPYMGLGNSLQTAQASGGGAGGIGGWVELGRTTLGSKTSPMTVASLADKRYYMVLSSALADGTNRAAAVRRMGNGSVDTGSNYASRRNDNGGLESTNLNVSQAAIVNLGSDSTPQFGVDYVSNLSSKEKLAITHLVLQNTAGAGTAPDRAESVWKWTNTSNPLDTYQITREPSESGDWETGSEVVVLGWDPADTHTSNFWEELYSGSGTSIDTGVAGFTAKKYLWIQIYQDGLTSATAKMVLNGDTGSTNALRYSLDGATDSTFINNSSGLLYRSGVTGDDEAFTNIFMINNSSQNKLAITHNVVSRTAGAGTAPNRQEIVNKSTVSAQITDIQLTGTYGSNSIMKIWGSD
jgi:hypothetical protein